MHRVDLEKLKIEVLRIVISQKIPLQKQHLRLIRDHFKLSEFEFGKIFGVREATISGWEKGEPIPRSMHLFIRMYVREKLREAKIDFKEQYQLNIVNLARTHKRRRKVSPLTRLLEDGFL